jgi:hypothetical protein
MPCRGYKTIYFIHRMQWMQMNLSIKAQTLKLWLDTTKRESSRSAMAPPRRYTCLHVPLSPCWLHLSNYNYAAVDRSQRTNAASGVGIRGGGQPDLSKTEKTKRLDPRYTIRQDARELFPARGVFGVFLARSRDQRLCRLVQPFERRPGK